MIPFAILLPRLVGPFKLGAGGLEGELADAAAQGTEDQARELKLSPEQQEALAWASREAVRNALARQTARRRMLVDWQRGSTVTDDPPRSTD